MAAKSYVQSQTLYLAGSGVLVGATSIVLISLTDIYGNAITNISSFGDKGYITCEPDTSNEEGATFTSVTANANGTVTLGGVSTILAQSPYTETSGLVRSHSGGTKVVITDNVAFWNTFGNKNNDEVLTGRWTTGVTPSTANDLVNKAYVDGVAVAGAPNASTTVKGIVEEATQAEVLAKTAAGGTAARLFVNPSTLPSTLLSDYKVDTGVADAYVITPAPAITAYTAGQIFSFKASATNTTASTLNVNALGAKNIFFNGAALVGGEILINTIVVVEYDGTQFGLVSAPNNVLTTNTSPTKVVDATQLAAETITTGQALAVGPYQSDGGIILDVAQGSSQAATAGSLTVALTVANHSNRALLLYVGHGTNRSISATYQGVSMVRTLDKIPSGASYFGYLSAFSLIAPSVGAFNIVITGLSGTEQVGYCAYSYYNVDQTTPVAQSVSASSSNSTTISKDVTPSSIGAVLLSAVIREASADSPTKVNFAGNAIAKFTVYNNPDTSEMYSGDSYKLANLLALTVSSVGTGIAFNAIGVMEIKPFTASTYRASLATSNAGSTIGWNTPWKSTAFVGFSAGGYALNATVTSVINGIATGLSGLAPGNLYYLNDTAGTVGLAVGTNTRKVGIATSTTTMLITNTP